MRGCDNRQMEISERKKKILAAVVDAYIVTAEPVGSKTLAETAGLGCSSATIRNELAELVNMGFLEQPHTSAGRVPTPLGYRMYVNELMQKQKLSLEETEELNQRLEKRLNELDNTNVICLILCCLCFILCSCCIRIALALCSCISTTCH